MNTPEPQGWGLIFDFDGVVALSEPVHAGAWDDVARHFGRDLPAGFAENGIGTTDQLGAIDLARQWGGLVPGESVLEAKRRFYRERARLEAEFVPGVVEALSYFSGRAPMAIATSSSRGDIEPWFDRGGLRSYFSAVLTIESVSDPKPHPEIYLAAAERLGLPPERCIVFEDSVQGARAARAAGTRLIGLTTSFEAEALAPLDAHMADFSDLPFLLRCLEHFSDTLSK